MIPSGENVKSYLGGRIGKSWSEWETTQSGVDDQESTSTTLAPVFGAEYFITDDFSFGGEIAYQISTTEDDMVSEWDGETYGTSTTIETVVLPKFIVRFYF